MSGGRVIVVGGGAAGLMASVVAAKNKKNVILVEKNNELGKKLKITGGGRCNITNVAPPEKMIDHVMRNKKFLYPAFNSLDSSTLLSFFEEEGLSFKTEEEGKIFPSSNSSQEVINCFIHLLNKYKVEVIYNQEVKEIFVDDSRGKGVLLGNNHMIYGNSIIIATGGLSYPSTGSTGDGYSLAKKIGHKIIPVKASLVPLKIKEKWVPSLMGVSINNVRIALPIKKNKLVSFNGGLIFTHFGISGPAVLKLSAELANRKENSEAVISIDIAPHLSKDELEGLVIKGNNAGSNKSIKNILNQLLPKSFITIMLHQLNILEDKPINQITKEERLSIIHFIKQLQMTVTASTGIKEAIVTAGGIDVKEVNPSTMESKLTKGVFFAGELLDVDALTGGYNLHIAFSTGYLAGLNA